MTGPAGAAARPRITTARVNKAGPRPTAQGADVEDCWAVLAESEPEVWSVPDAPVVSVPDVSVPDVFVPDVSEVPAPEVSVPDVPVLEPSVPDVPDVASVVGVEVWPEVVGSVEVGVEVVSVELGPKAVLTSWCTTPGPTETCISSIVVLNWLAIASRSSRSSSASSLVWMLGRPESRVDWNLWRRSWSACRPSVVIRTGPSVERTY